MKEAKSNFILREAEKSNKLLPLPTRSFVSSYSFSSVTGAGGGICICPPPNLTPSNSPSDKEEFCCADSRELQV